MVAGISTASYYPEVPEFALKRMAVLGVKAAEVFINAPSELEKPYLRELRRIADRGGVRIVSIHPFTSEMEPLLFFSAYERRYQDGLELYKKFFEAANLLGADLLVFHGDRRQTQRTVEEYCERFQGVMEAGERMGVTVAQENVPRCAAWNPAFFRSMAHCLPEARFVLDVKQSVRAGFSASEMAGAMGRQIAHLHISDRDDASDCLTVGIGNSDLVGLIAQLKSQGFDGAVIEEVYRNSYGTYGELEASYALLLQLADGKKPESFGYLKT